MTPVGQFYVDSHDVQRVSDIQAIDTMCRYTYVRPEAVKPFFETYEFQVIAENTYAGVKERHGIPDDESWRVHEVLGHTSVESLIDEMDEQNVEYAFMDQLTHATRRDAEVLQVASVEEMADLVKQSDGRVVPGASYNPRRIQESLQEIERAVEDHDFKYVWFHPASFGLRPDDQKCYPLYAKCVELDIPVCYQTGQSAEPLPTEPGRPMYADEVAMDFPDLTLVLTHTGWPWTEEWCSMLWRHPNVYGNMGGYYPHFLPDSQVDFIDSSKIRDSVMWGTNGLGIERCLDEFMDLPFREKTRRRVLRENALDVFDL